MPVPPRPITFECPQCHWARTFVPQSDAIFLPDWAKQCPRCGHDGMQSKAPSPLWRVFDMLKLK
jgi:hypothetical protein